MHPLDATTHALISLATRWPSSVTQATLDKTTHTMDQTNHMLACQPGHGHPSAAGKDHAHDGQPVHGGSNGRRQWVALAP